MHDIEEAQHLRDICSQTILTWEIAMMRLSEYEGKKRQNIGAIVKVTRGNGRRVLKS